MKKIKYLFLFGIIALIGLFFNFSSASYDLELKTGGKLTNIPNYNGYTTLYIASYGPQYVGEIYCFSGTINSGSVKFWVGFGQDDIINQYNPPRQSQSQITMSTSNSDKHNFVCFSLVQYTVNYIVINSINSSAYSNIDIDYQIYQLKTSSGGCPTIDQNYCTSNNLCPSPDYSGYVLENDVTENYCTNKFSSLIPESEITTGYCETELGMITPENCPASGGTGDVLRSSFWVNNYQVQGASNIYLYLPEFLTWDYTYIDNGNTLQVDVENEGDPDYINDILTVQTYHPSSDDFTVSFVGGLTLLIPYIIIILFIVFVWKLIKKIFR